MANVLTTQILENGDRNVVVKIVGVQDTSDLDYIALIDPALYLPNLGQLRVDTVTYSVEPGLSVSLWWDATVPGKMATFVGSGKFDARRYGGWENDVIGLTGLIGISTEGWAALAVMGFTLLIRMVKQEANSTPGIGLLLWQAPADALEWETDGFIPLA